MISVFIDASVLFAAAYSSHGHARDLIRLAIREELTLVVSELVLEETRRNLAESAPDHLVFLDLIVKSVPFEFVRPTKREVRAATKHVALKDAPIVAAARRARVNLLVTLDKKHLLGKPAPATNARAEIVTPKEVVAHLRRVN